MKYILIAVFMILWNSIVTAQNAGMIFLERTIENQYRYEIRTPLPQLTEELGTNLPVEMKYSIGNYEFDKLQRSLQTQGQFERMPEQNTWGVIGVLAAIVITMIVIRVAYGGS